ncbi:MAG TPA: hypothetical protein LFW21_01095, partial [Rickettsia endosymbiont of Pyrocoelia pectoralis]|nr:hypothetical protein [Rickettsia endosymbiont of Pyrocoelia pectoralis]
KESKYSAEFKLEAIMLYVNSMGIRAIGRIKKVHNSLISVWIKQMGKGYYQRVDNLKNLRLSFEETVSLG